MQALKIEQLMLFQDVVKMRSKAAVAKKYGLSIQNVSYALETLAKELRTTLFEAGGAKYQLTESGAIVYDFAVRQLKAYYRLMAEPKSEEAQCLRIDIVRRLEEIIMPNLTIELLKQNIDNKITVFRPDTLEEMLERLRKGQSDLAIFWDIKGSAILTDKPEDALVKRVLFLAQPYIWVPEASELAERPFLQASDLDGWKAVVSSDGNEELTQRYTAFLQDKQIFFRTDHKELMAKFVDKALAVCFDFMLPGGKCIMQEIFAPYAVRALPFVNGCTLACVMMYRRDEKSPEIAQWLI